MLILRYGDFALENAIWDDVVYLQQLFEKDMPKVEYEWDMDNDKSNISYEWEIVGGKKRRKFIPKAISDKIESIDWAKISDKIISGILKLAAKYGDKLIDLLKVLVKRVGSINKRWLRLAFPLILMTISYSTDYDAVINRLSKGEKDVIEEYSPLDEKTLLEYYDNGGIKRQIGRMMKSQDSLERVQHEETIKWANALKDKESSNRWWIDNGHYIGYYQMGKVALADLHRKGFKFQWFKDNKIKQTEDGVEKLRLKFISINDDKSLSSEEKKMELMKLFPPEEQEEAFIFYSKINKHYLRNHIKHVGKTIGGIKLTLSGILAGAHLGGIKNLKQFINSNGSIIFRDGNNTPITDYIKNYGKYNIKL